MCLIRPRGFKSRRDFRAYACILILLSRFIAIFVRVAVLRNRCEIALALNGTNGVCSKFARRKLAFIVSLFMVLLFMMQPRHCSFTLVFDRFAGFVRWFLFILIIHQLYLGLFGVVPRNVFVTRPSRFTNVFLMIT